MRKGMSLQSLLSNIREKKTFSFLLLTKQIALTPVLSKQKGEVREKLTDLVH